MQHIDGIPLLFETGLHEIGDLLVVFNYQDAH